MIAFRSTVAVVLAAALRIALGGGRYEVIRSGSTRKSDETDDKNEYTYPAMSVLKLNRFIFDGNVVQCLGQHTDHWIVQFCPNWYGPCQKFLPIFKNTSVQWQDKLNSDIVMRSRARFADVDCATDKELCNEQLVDEYPTVVHYFGGQRVSRWTADSESEFKGLSRWVQEELRSAREPLGHSKASKRNAKEETVIPAEITWLSLLMFVPVFIGPLLIVIRGADLVPSGVAASSASPATQHRHGAAREKIFEEEPGSPVAATASDASTMAATASSVSSFMPTEWASEMARTRSNTQSMEL